MSLRVNAGKLASEIVLPGSKSHANRYIILAARRGNNTTVHNVPTSEDVTNLLASLKAIGLDFSLTDNKFTVNKPFPECEINISEPIDLNVGEGGTTARFLLALLSTGTQTYRLHLSGRLGERPWSELIEALTQAKVRVHQEKNLIEIQGPAQLSFLPRTVSAARSTQFATALQLAFHQDKLKFDVTALNASGPYWTLTQKCIEEIDSGEEVEVPLDWSSAAYPLCLGAVLGKEVFLPRLKFDPDQADSVIFEILNSKGAIEVTPEGIKTKPLADRSPIKKDMRHCLDLAPALAFLCTHLEGESVLEGLEGLVHKESDRLDAIRYLVQSVGGTVKVQNYTLSIQGPTSRGPWKLYTPADHRMVMTAALFLNAHHGGTLENGECVEKSFPNFFKIMGF